MTMIKIFALEHYEMTKTALENCEMPQYYKVTYEFQTLKVLIAKKNN